MRLSTHGTVLHYETRVTLWDSCCTAGFVIHGTCFTLCGYPWNSCHSWKLVTSCYLVFVSSCPRVLVLPLIDSFDLCSIVLRPTLDFSQQKVQTVQGKLLIPFQRVMSLSSEPQNLRKKQLKNYSPFLKRLPKKSRCKSRISSFNNWLSFSKCTSACKN